MDEYLIYTCAAGETVDQVALKMYGTDKYAYKILEANPRYVMRLYYEGGEELKVPVIRMSEITETVKPVWMR